MEVWQIGHDVGAEENKDLPLGLGLGGKLGGQNHLPHWVLVVVCHLALFWSVFKKTDNNVEHPYFK